MEERISIIRLSCFILFGFLIVSMPSFGDVLTGIEARRRGDYEAAIKEFKSPAESGDEKAIFYLGISYQDLLRETYKRRGDSKTVIQAAMAALKPLASSGNKEAQYWLARIYSFELNDEEKFFWLGQAAKQEHGPAQWALGSMYKNGREGKEFFTRKSVRIGPDYYEARKWFEKAAENGEHLGMEDLGHLYANGRGVARDYAMAIKWFEAAIREGNSGALLALGSLYELGKGVPRDQKKAEDLYSKALSRGDFFATLLAEERVGAAKGDADAEYKLGYSWLGASGLVEDVEEALRLMNRAAEKLHVQAITTLGFMSKDGWKAPQDYVTAHKWYNIGASLGDDKAKSERDELASKMTPSQVAEAQKLAREWMESRKRK